MRKLIFILFLVSASLNAQVLRTNPFYVSPYISGGSESVSLANGLLVYYNLDENGLTFADAVGSNDATGVSVSQNGTYKILGYSQEFNNAEDYIYVSATNTTPANDKLTISLWVRMTTMPVTKGSASVLAFCHIPDDVYYWAFVLYVSPSDNKVNFLAHNQSGTMYSVVSSGALSVNTLYHIAAICRGNGQTLQLFVNGSDVSSSAGTFSGTGFLDTPSRGNLIFGNGGTPGTEPVIGIMDEIGLWNRSVAADSLYNGGTGITHPFN